MYIFDDYTIILYATYSYGGSLTKQRCITDGRIPACEDTTFLFYGI